MKFDIWQSGVCLMETDGIPTEAEFMGTYEADTFEEACKIMVKDKHCEKLYDEKRNAIWGCKLCQTKEECSFN